MTLRTFENATPQINDEVYIDDTALIIGDVNIAQDSSVWPFTVIRADVNHIQIGECTNIQDHSVLHVSHIGGPYNPEGNALVIGNRITVGHRVTLHGCTVHDDCLIGMGSTIMDGAIIHSDTIIGAGSLVASNKELEAGYLWLGSPARRVRALSDNEKESIRYSAQHYLRLKQRYLKP
ncbi:Carbonic anhydrase, gamma class [hydrothermal vent metagenome]|uniref:Carbonic anhydrase, gamma class n=1 Tax=hydrothermal vent metagenome TaxID=652676 RepID=A0A3B1BH36_9ZZZZ